MRSHMCCSWRSLTIGVVGLFVVLLIALRHHIGDISEVIHTYSTFYKTLEQHPALIFPYDPLSELPSPSTPRDDLDDRSTPAIPKIIHQIYLTNGRAPPAALTDPTADYADINNNNDTHQEGHTPVLSGKHSSAQQTCRALHPTWEFRLWTDAAADAFLAEHHPTIFPFYEGYAQNIQRANVLRYAVLATFGGVYLDLDVACRVPLDPLIDGGEIRSGVDNDDDDDDDEDEVWEKHPRRHIRTPGFLTPAAYPAGVNNAFILARPGHPFLAALLARLPSHAHRRVWALLPYVENMLSTGCMFFSNAWVEYVQGEWARGQQQQRRKGRKQEDETAHDNAVYVLADRTGNLEAQMLRGKVVTPLFEHGGASSWHGWDAAAIVFVGAHYGWLALGLVGVVIGCVGVGLVVSRRRWFSHSTAAADAASRRTARHGYSLLGDMDAEAEDEDEEQVLSKEV